MMSADRASDDEVSAAIPPLPWGKPLETPPASPQVVAKRVMLARIDEAFVRRQPVYRVRAPGVQRNNAGFWLPVPGQPLSPVGALLANRRPAGGGVVEMAAAFELDVHPAFIAGCVDGVLDEHAFEAETGPHAGHYLAGHLVGSALQDHILPAPVQRPPSDFASALLQAAAEHDTKPDPNAGRWSEGSDAR